MSDRLSREKGFHEARFAPGAQARSADCFYAINERSDAFYRAAVARMPEGSRVLDYGCGDQPHAALTAAEQGHKVSAIDLSPIAVEQARMRAEERGLLDRIDFREMNAEELEFRDAAFDMVCGLGVLHHLDLDKSISEVRRVLRPGGRAVFLEPLGHNPVINWYRNRTPHERSPDEHPLLMEDLDRIEQGFARTEATFFHLAGLLALPLAGRPRFRRSLAILDGVDRLTFRWLPPSRRLAWVVGLDVTR